MPYFFVMEDGHARPNLFCKTSAPRSSYRPFQATVLNGLWEFVYDPKVKTMSYSPPHSPDVVRKDVRLWWVDTPEVRTGNYEIAFEWADGYLKMPRRKRALIVVGNFKHACYRKCRQTWHAFVNAKRAFVDTFKSIDNEATLHALDAMWDDDIPF